MSRLGLDKATVIERAARLANEKGIENITMKTLSKELGIQSPSLYNHISGISDLKREIMLYGWQQLEKKLLYSAIGVSGYEALRLMCYAFFDYATENKGIFNVMLWYNKFENTEMEKSTERLFTTIHKLTSGLNITRRNSEHLIRTLRGFLEGYCLLVNNEAFGNPLPIRESFELSVEIILNGIKTIEENEIKNRKAES